MFCHRNKLSEGLNQRNINTLPVLLDPPDHGLDIHLAKFRRIENLGARPEQRSRQVIQGK